jgi:hypothetical protein
VFPVILKLFAVLLTLDITEKSMELLIRAPD